MDIERQRWSGQLLHSSKKELPIGYPMSHWHSCPQTRNPSFSLVTWEKSEISQVSYITKVVNQFLSHAHLHCSKNLWTYIRGFYRHLVTKPCLFLRDIFIKIESVLYNWTWLIRYLAIMHFSHQTLESTCSVFLATKTTFPLKK